METKHCSKCDLDKPISEFSRNKSRPDGLCYWCKLCANRGNQKVYHADIEQSRAQQREKESHRKPHRKAYHKEWYKKNRDAKLAQNKEWSEAHKPQHRAMIAEWFLRHPEHSREYSQQRIAYIQESTISDLTSEQWEEIKQAYGNRCVYCPDDCQACKKKTHRLSKDHITPLSKGGSHTAPNIVPACKSCNSKKHAGSVPKPIQPLLLTIAPPRGK